MTVAIKIQCISLQNFFDQIYLLFAIQTYSEDRWFVAGNVGDAMLWPDSKKISTKSSSVCAVELEWRVISAFVERRGRHPPPTNFT